MRNFFKAGFIWGAMLLSSSAAGQAIPLGALPMEYNGSFAGEAGAPRLSLNSFYGWMYTPSANLTSTNFITDVSYDQYIPALRTGIGFSTSLGRISSEYITSPNDPYNYNPHYNSNFQEYSFNLAPKISIKGKYTLSPSIDINYINDKIKNAHYPGTYEVFSSRVGLLWNTSTYYIGYSFNILDRVRYNGERQPNNHHFISYLQLGYTYQKSEESNFAFTPQILILATYPYRNQNENLINQYIHAYNLNFRYKKFIWGVNNAGVQIGFQNDRLRLMMTNDIGFFGDNKKSGVYNPENVYDGNLSVRYIFK